MCAAVDQGRPGRTNLQRQDPPKRPWEFLQLDFIGPLPSAKGAYPYCLVIIDNFFKWIEAIPTRNNTANTVARVLGNQIIPLWGAPMQIESDQGTHFTGQVTHSHNDAQFNPTSETTFADQIMVRVFVKQKGYVKQGPYVVKAVCNSCIAMTIRGKLRWYPMTKCKLFKGHGGGDLTVFLYSIPGRQPPFHGCQMSGGQRCSVGGATGAVALGAKF